ncbi:MAG: AMP-dependent synthetase [Candidatus Rokuibacteriota bacterium]|nr:MAG: AMP-dependent synthetase [Candidatus Rokubacteria bacterium]
MATIDFLLDIFDANRTGEAIVWRDRVFSFGWLAEAVRDWRRRLQDDGLVRSGSVVSLEADFSPQAISLLLALVEHRCIIVPLTTSVEARKPEFSEVAEVEAVVRIGDGDEVHVEPTTRTARHPLLRQLQEAGRPGLVLFSSGSTGKSKAALHDFGPLLEKFTVPRRRLRAMGFLLFDHIGGVNTLLYTLSNAGCVVTVPQRLPETVCAAIARWQVELLPTSPTFLNLVLLSEAYRRHDLSSLKLITYGTEVMLESTLRRMREVLPGVELLQTYGLSELGILRSKSKSSDSLWMKIGGEGFETRVVDGLLEIKARSAMLGYLNAPSPFTADGWFRTGDAVAVDGEYVHILGRRSEIINVGGEKVYPAEVESAIQLMEGVSEVVATGEKNAITGEVVTARVKLETGETVAEFRRRMRAFCEGRLARFKIPQKVVLVTDDLRSERFKKLRHEQVS